MIGLIDTTLLLDTFGKAHPAVSHFPIALLIAALLAELIAWWRASVRFHSASRYCLFLGTAGSIFATLSGFPFETIMFLSSRPPLLLHHRLWAYSVVLTAIITCILILIIGKRITRRGLRVIYILLLIILTTLIIITGHTGGKMVYGEDFFDLTPPTSSIPSV
jgi:uncharacterized membrane protein